MIRNNYSPEQLEIFRELHQKLVDSSNRIEKYVELGANANNPFLRHEVVMFAGFILPEYEEKVPEDIRAEFNFDIEKVLRNLEKSKK